MNCFEACNATVVVPVNTLTILDMETRPLITTLATAPRQGFRLQGLADDGSCERCMESGVPLRLESELKNIFLLLP